MRNLFQRVLLLLLLMLSVLIIASCGTTEEKKWKPSYDWGRSILIGRSAAGSIGLLVDGEGELTHIIWPMEKDGGMVLHYVQLNEQSEQILSRDFNYQGGLKSPRILKADEFSNHLIWANREPGTQNWGLWHVQIDKDGIEEGSPVLISPEGKNVGKVVAESDHIGGVILAWDTGEQGNLYLLHLDKNGDTVSGPWIITTDGKSPSLQVSPEGIVHLAWLTDRSFYYGTGDIEELGAFEWGRIVNLSQWGTLGTTGDTLVGPALGYSDGYVYVFWSILSRKDVEAGTAAAEYITFPAGAIEEYQPERLWILEVKDQPFIEYGGNFSLSQLSPPTTFLAAVEEYGQTVVIDHPLAGDWHLIVGAVSEYIMNPFVMSGDHDGELATAWVVSQPFRQHTELEIATAIFSGGEFSGYSIATKTGDMSDKPVLFVDDAGNFHMVWREGAYGKSVFYTTTAPSTRAALDQLGAGDFFQLGMQFVMEGLASITFLPAIGFCWILPGLLIVGGWTLFRRPKTDSVLTSRIALIVAIVIYYVFKFLSLPAIATYVPFSAWMYIPASMELPLRIFIPVLILGLSLVGAYAIHKRYNTSMFLFYISVVLIDAILTLVVYGVSILGIF
ncbi:MAG: hypothetical protein GTO18_20775 [Anaerolineales bacterium]|nr:hypothetical protein [Anaerolineales bacterium]